MTSDRGTGRKELSDSEGVDLAYALLMDALDSDNNLITLKGKAQTLFRQFGIELDENDLKKIEPELREMLVLAKDRGLWGKIELGLSKGDQTTGAVLEDVGKKMKNRRTPGLSDIAARTYFTVFKGAHDVLVDIARAALVTLDTIAKKVNFSVWGKHGQLSLSKRDVLVARIVRRLNPTPVARTPRRIRFTGSAMIHAARVSKSQEPRSARGSARGVSN